MMTNTGTASPPSAAPTGAAEEKEQLKRAEQVLRRRVTEFRAGDRVPRDELYRPG